MKTAVKDVMTTRVVSVRKDTSFKEMAAALRENRVSAFPVTDDDGKVIGVVSEADLLTKQALDGGYDGMPGMITGLLRHKEQGKARGMTAGDLMTGPAVTVVPGDTVEDAARLMYKRKVKRLPVIDTDGRLAGIISRADVLSVYGRPAAEIAREIRQDVIMTGFRGDPGSFTVTVKDGIVTLEGFPDTTRQGRNILAEAWHIEGVVSVRDRLTYPEARSSDV